MLSKIFALIKAKKVMLKYTTHTWLELNTSALNYNIRQYKKIIGNRKLAFVVKGNAYGHGIDHIIQLTQHNDIIDWYCTFSLSEALHLRRLGVTKPILVLGLIDQDPALACTQQIDLMIQDMHQLTLVSEASKQQEHKARIHLNIDTGLGIGFAPDEALALIKELQSTAHIELRGISTHCAAAEQEDQSYTERQLEQFNKLLLSLQKEHIGIAYRHAHATAAALRQSGATTNLVRIGAGLYGLWPSELVKGEAQNSHAITLKQIATWKTYIFSIKTLSKGSSIGYGYTYTAQQQMRIATVPVGYADGYHRRLSNAGQVRINGCYAPVIGRVAMNSAFVDITHIPSAHIGSEVILMGDYPGMTALDLANQIGSYNPREITTRLPSTLERRIVEEQIIGYTRTPNITVV